jgi:hypothetical protein
MTKFEKKVRLYCALYGNLVNNLPSKWIDNSYGNSDSDTCKKCRVKNNGICNVRYFTYRIVYDYPSHQILKINFKKLPITYSPHHGTMYLDEKEYPTKNIHWVSVCFGFLAIDKVDNDE